MLTPAELLATFSAEDRLLLAGARVQLDPVQRVRLRSLAAGAIDWERVLERANTQKVLPLLARQLLAACRDLLPPELEAYLRSSALTVAHQNLLLTAELLRVLSMFGRHGIEAFPFKGPALAAQVYGNPGLRRFGDIDVWIRPESFLRARELLLAEGYIPFEPPPDEVLPYYTDTHHEYGFTSSNGLVHLELLWRVIERPFAFPRKTESLWGSLVPVKLAGHNVPGIPLDLLLICLCVHGSKHLWERLIWVCDVAETVRSLGEVDWDALLATAHSHGAGRMVLLGLFLAHTLLDTPLPQAVLQRCADDAEVGRLATVAMTMIVEGMPDSVFETLHLYQMRMLNRFDDRLRVVRRYAYNFLNPLHVYRKYGLGPVRHLLGR